MKKLVSAAIAVALTIMCASAQPPQGGQGGPRGPMTPAAMVEQMDKQLQLSDEQKTKLTEVFTNQQNEMKKMFEAMEEGERPDRDQMRAVFEKYTNQVKAVLNDEQKAKYEEMAKQRPGGPRPDGPRPDGPRPDGPRPENR